MSGPKTDDTAGLRGPPPRSHDRSPPEGLVAVPLPSQLPQKQRDADEENHDGEKDLSDALRSRTRRVRREFTTDEVVVVKIVVPGPLVFDPSGFVAGTAFATEVGLAPARMEVHLP